VSGLISNFKLRISNSGRFFRLSLFLCAFCAFAGNIAAQTVPSPLTQEELDSILLQKNFKSVFEKGTVEEKRTALFEIRNLQDEVYSKTAIPALRDANEIVRATAAFSVIFLPADEAFNVLAPNLQDKTEIVRRETAYALGKIQNSSAIDPLVQTFQKEKSVEVKNACIVALGEIGDASAVDFLIQIFKPKPTEKDEFLRRSAARSIGQIAQIIQIKQSYTVTPESFLPEKFKLFTLEKYRNLSTDFSQFRAAVPVLMQILQSPREDNDTKRETAFALGAIGDVSALAVLQNQLNAKDYYLAEICKESVKKLSSVNSTE
jgi:HEAT repeat protein